MNAIIMPTILFFIFNMLDIWRYEHRISRTVVVQDKREVHQFGADTDNHARGIALTLLIDEKKDVQGLLKKSAIRCGNQ